MTIERSHGKARPTLPRSSDLAVVKTERSPSEGRDASGRFASGNTTARGAQWRRSIKRLLGATGENDGDRVAHEATRLYLATSRELPSDGAMVRTLAALQARHAALAAHFTTQAARAGLESEKGLALLELALRHGQRAERLAVTTIDVSTKMAASGKGQDDAAAFARLVDQARRPRAAPTVDPRRDGFAVSSAVAQAGEVASDGREVVTAEMAPGVQWPCPSNCDGVDDCPTCGGSLERAIEPGKDGAP